MTMTTSMRELEQKRTRLRQWIPEDKQESITRGVDHVAVFAKDLEATAAFYTNVLGLPVVSVTFNRDVPESTHMNVTLMWRWATECSFPSLTSPTFPGCNAAPR